MMARIFIVFVFLIYVAIGVTIAVSLFGCGNQISLNGDSSNDEIPIDECFDGATADGSEECDPVMEEYMDDPEWDDSEG